ncbi:MAG: Zn-ribbon domain-containing OB-fold protein [Acetobacteraceae bacterium]
MRPMDAAAARGIVALQRCATCGRVQYPPRELCGVCLGDAVEWQESEAVEADLLAATVLHHSHDPVFAAALPLRVGLAQLTAGPVAVVFLDAACVPGMRVRLAAELDRKGRAVLHATVAL